ncbi:MAG: OmpA family protein, partial [Gammaproteobacteria bacterium]|nr:OmpA family protein [Gammaproteobacteria bacterium]
STNALYRNVNCGMCKEKVSVDEVNLPADTLFKFDRFTKQDLLPKGRHQLDRLAARIVADQSEVEGIALIGHTDRLGSFAYNDALGLNRAKTIRAYLKDKGVTTRIDVSSQGEYQPRTDGCFRMAPGQALRDCLQPDRRVTVKIFRVTKTKECNLCGIEPMKKVGAECQQCTYVDGVETDVLGSDSLFKFDKYKLEHLLSKGRPALNKLATKLIKKSDDIKKVALIGHTDRKGSDAYNNVLGLNRAKTIRSYLKNKGVSARMTVDSRGEREPVTDGCHDMPGRTQEIHCLQPDRRVVVQVFTKKKELKCTKCGDKTPTTPTTGSRELFIDQGDLFNLSSDTLFKFDKFARSEVLPETLTELERFTQALRDKYSNIEKIVLIGHTDRLGSYEYNDVLGLNRAKTVRAYLQEHGIRAQIEVQSRGEHEPVTDGCRGIKCGKKLKACLQPDRRVEVRVFGTKKDKQQCDVK